MKRLSTLVATAAVLSIAGHVAAQEPVHFSELIKAIPEKVEGYEAEKPEGSTTSAMGFKVTNVSRVFNKGSEKITINITDGAGNQMFAAAHAMAAQFSTETMEGYDKGFKLDGHQAIEHYENENKSGSLSVFVGGRFVVEVEIEGLPSSAMQEWFKKVDTKKLEELKKS